MDFCLSGASDDHSECARAFPGWMLPVSCDTDLLLARPAAAANTNTRRCEAAVILPRTSADVYPLTHRNSLTLQSASDFSLMARAVETCTNLTSCSWHAHVRCSRLVSVHFSGLSTRSAPSPVFLFCVVCLELWSVSPVGCSLETTVTAVALWYSVFLAKKKKKSLQS